MPQGGLSVDSISDLVESQSRLLEALQLSHPAELELKKTQGGGGSGTSGEGRTQTKLSLNPIYRQVPRVLERCCAHIETYGEYENSENSNQKKDEAANVNKLNTHVAPCCVLRSADGGNFQSR